MRKSVLFMSMLSGFIAAGISSCNTGKSEDAPAVAVSSDSLISRGNYLVSVAGCDDCHSPKKFGPQGPEIDMERRLSGFPSDRPLPKYDSNVIKMGMILFNEDLTSAAGPWGVSFSANLSSDGSGVGNWTEAQFFKAVREGKSKGLDGNRGLLPPMPWQNLSKMTDNDLKAIFAFLKSTKPVNNVVPAARQLADLK